MCVGRGVCVDVCGFVYVGLCVVHILYYIRTDACINMYVGVHIFTYICR